MRSWLPFLALFLLVTGLLTGCRQRSEGSDSKRPDSPPADPAQLRIYMDPIGRAGLINRMLVQNFMQESGLSVQIISTDQDSTDRLDRTTQILASRTSGIDILMIDSTWAPILHQYTEDLAPLLAGDSNDFFPQLLRQNTAQGKLVGIPMYVDLGLLYYRTDLLEKYGYDHPPATWEEMTEMATRVQAGERAAGNGNFWGLALAAAPQESLTCTALEWQASNGGGNIISDGGRVTVNNRATLESLEMAASWIGTIAQPEAVSMDVEMARRQFQEGNALFMRNWSYAWELLNDDTSIVRGKTKVSLLPGGAGGSRSVLGGWQLAISSSSTRKASAWKLVRYMTSARSQRIRAIEGGFPPTRPALYDDPVLRQQQPHLGLIESAVDTAIMRPARGARSRYGQVSIIYFSGVTDALSGKTKPEVALDVMELKIKRALER